MEVARNVGGQSCQRPHTRTLQIVLVFMHFFPLYKNMECCLLVVPFNGTTLTHYTNHAMPCHAMPCSISGYRVCCKLLVPSHAQFLKFLRELLDQFLAWHCAGCQLQFDIFVENFDIFKHKCTHNVFTYDLLWIRLVFEGPHGELLFCYGLIRIDP